MAFRMAGSYTSDFISGDCLFPGVSCSHRSACVRVGFNPISLSPMAVVLITVSDRLMKASRVTRMFNIRLEMMVWWA
jgi:hypothetical protein